MSMKGPVQSRYHIDGPVHFHTGSFCMKLPCRYGWGDCCVVCYRMTFCDCTNMSSLKTEIAV